MSLKSPFRMFLHEKNRDEEHQLLMEAFSNVKLKELGCLTNHVSREKKSYKETINHFSASKYDTWKPSSVLLVKKGVCV